MQVTFFPHHICMWPLIGAEFAALWILAVNNGQQHHNNHKEHQRRNCLKAGEKEMFVTVSQAPFLFWQLQPVVQLAKRTEQLLTIQISSQVVEISDDSFLIDCLHNLNT